MTNPGIESGVLGFLAIIAVALIAFEVYRYIKGHPQALASLTARVEALESTAKQDIAGLISAFNRLRDKIEGGSAPSGTNAPASGGGGSGTNAGVGGTNANPPVATQPAPLPVPVPTPTQPPTPTPPVATPTPTPTPAPQPDPAPQFSPVNDGFALIANGRPLRNSVTNMERLVYTFNNVGFRLIQMQVMGAPGSFFFHATYSVVNRAGTVVVSQTTNQYAMGGGPINFDPPLPPDDYMLVLQVDGTGILAVQYQGWV